MNATFTTDEAREIAGAIRQQITGGVLMSLGAHNFAFSDGSRTTTGDPGLLFIARILPFNKAGKRTGTPRLMSVQVTLNAADLYDIRVTYPQRGDRFRTQPPVTHAEFDDVDCSSLARIMLSLDSDGDRDE